jgi:predicted flap endonuclease-1-like 5' DNA nuclease
MPSIGELDSINPRSATKLRKAGIRTTEALLRRASTRKARAELADQTGIESSRILEWAHKADLMRVKGIGGEYADLLHAAGVGTLKELRRRNPDSLLARLDEVNQAKGLVSRLPTRGMVARWIEDAGQMEPAVRS